MEKILNWQLFLESEKYIAINEEIAMREIWDKAINKIKEIPKISQKKLIQSAIFTLLTIGSVTSVVKFINNSNADDDVKIEAISAIDRLEVQNGSLFTLSDKGWDHIREEEKLKLKAYKLGDRMITIGYGHAEKIGKSKYREGQRITEEEADKLLRSDLKEKAVTGLNRSPIMAFLKERNYEKAAESIKDFKVLKRFPGLKNRRQHEYDLFVAGL
jgi:GH24 family phage-related lysozyme (muramidase)